MVWIRFRIWNWNLDWNRSRNRNRNQNFSKVGTGIAIKCYGSTKLVFIKEVEFGFES
jgi:hypothetical protein